MVDQDTVTSADKGTGESVAADARDRAGRFGPGNPGYKLRLAAAAERDATTPRVPRLLHAMRSITERPESKDRTQLQRECRLWLKEDRRGFLTKLGDLEKALTVRRAKAAKEGDPGSGRGSDGLLPDPTSERTEEMIGRMLEEAGAFLELLPSDRALLIERGLVGGHGDDWRLTAEGRRALGLPAVAGSTKR